MTISIEDLKKADAMTALIQGDEDNAPMTFAEAETYWKEQGGAKRTGFRATFYEELAQRDMDAAEVKEFCETYGSKNDAKAYTHYVAIADLVRAVRD